MPARIIDEGEVRSIVDRVRLRFGERPARPEPEPPARPPAETGDGVFEDIHDAVEAAARAFEQFGELGLDRRPPGRGHRPDVQPRSQSPSPLASRLYVGRSRSS